jgi:hypothetical protein
MQTHDDACLVTAEFAHRQQRIVVTTAHLVHPSVGTLPLQRGAAGRPNSASPEQHD